MEIKDVEEAVLEAKRFLKRAKEFQAEHKKMNHRFIFGSKASAAMKRASLDLSRALSKMRAPRKWGDD